eukprot:5582525-Ditylum_brightwellii.AAC.1
MTSPTPPMVALPPSPSTLAPQSKVPTKSALSIFASKVVCSKQELTSGCVQYAKNDCTAHEPKESLNLAEKATTRQSTKISEINYKKFAKSSTDDSIFKNNVEVGSFIIKI